jgi:hypothetical protein
MDYWVSHCRDLIIGSPLAIRHVGLAELEHKLNIPNPLFELSLGLGVMQFGVVYTLHDPV